MKYLSRDGGALRQQPHRADRPRPFAINAIAPHDHVTAAAKPTGIDRRYQAIIDAIRQGKLVKAMTAARRHRIRPVTS